MEFKNPELHVEGTRYIVLSCDDEQGDGRREMVNTFSSEETEWLASHSEALRNAARVLRQNRIRHKKEVIVNLEKQIQEIKQEIAQLRIKEGHGDGSGS